MEAYHSLAQSYDRLTNDVDYSAIVAFYRKLLDREGLHPRTAADLACGTGSIAVRLAAEGLRVIGVDMSEEMLTQAQQKACESSANIQFICQPLQKLRLLRAVDLAVSALDAVDYITDPADCACAFRRIYRALNPGGIFIFDVNTPQKLRDMDGQIFLDEDDGVYCVWRGEFEEESNICSYGMDLFQKCGDLWRRSFEEHREYAYSPEQLVEMLRRAGFISIEVFGDRRLGPVLPEDRRLYIKARKGVRK